MGCPQVEQLANPEGTYSYTSTTLSDPAAALVPKAENYLYAYGFLRFYVRLSMALTPVTPPIPRSLPSTFIPLRLPRASVEWVEQLAPTIAIPQHKVWTFGEIKTCWLKICPTSNPLIFARGCCILTLTLRDGAIKDWRRSSRVERGTYHPLKLPSVKTSNDMSSSSSR